MASNWHGKAWDDAFIVFKKFLKDDLHIRVSEELSNTIYENHFIAKREIYHEYVSQCLIPSMDFMKANESVFLQDSGYINKLQREPQRIKEYQEKTGRHDFPIAPFILERLFMIFIEGKGFNVINL